MMQGTEENQSLLTHSENALTRMEN